MKYWTICFIFLVFFIVGYSVNIIAIILDNTIVIEIMNSLVYLAGAIFVVGVLWISHQTYRLIKESVQD